MFIAMVIILMKKLKKITFNELIRIPNDFNENACEWKLNWVEDCQFYLRWLQKISELFYLKPSIIFEQFLPETNISAKLCFMLILLFFFDLFQIFSFLNCKYFQAINLEFVKFLIHNFPIKNETKRKKTWQLFSDNWFLSHPFYQTLF